ncbi:DUF6292 family protein [Amycolatopsis coloradensis]|uniref:DUF6292 family protein n=1 Tax=Amycolatopsis coloradensis TaxID=76021 RepID=A0ACD5BPS0_9PSEU
MILEDHGAPARGLRRYVGAVAQALDLDWSGWWVRLDPPVNAYVAIESRLPRFPTRDVALLWDEEHGWSVAVESLCGEELVVLSYAGKNILPPSCAVARFLTCMFRGQYPGQFTPPAFRRAGAIDDMPERLARYAQPSGTPPITGQSAAGGCRP